MAGGAVRVTKKGKQLEIQFRVAQGKKRVLRKSVKVDAKDTDGLAAAIEEGLVELRSKKAS